MNPGKQMIIQVGKDNNISEIISNDRFELDEAILFSIIHWFLIVGALLMWMRIMRVYSGVGLIIK